MIDRLYEPPDATAFFECYERTEGMAYILGGGTDTLICDGQITRPVISTKRLNEIIFDGRSVYAGAGARVPKLCAECAKRGLSGLEFMSSVGASVGGMVKMNAGAFGRKTADYVREISVLNVDSGKIEIIKREDTAFGYRRGAPGIIIGCTFVLEERSAEDTFKSRKRFAEIRAKKQPREPSLGSVFRNPDNVSAAKLIEECRLKGKRVNGAMISYVHANFIVNTGGGTAADYLALCEMAKSEVFKRFGIELKEEFVTLR